MSDNNLTRQFNYGQLDPTTQAFLTVQATAIRKLVKITLENIIQIGQRLDEVQNVLEDGQFKAWCDSDSFPLTRRMAYHFMNVYREFGGEDFSNRDIAVSALYMLAAPNTPVEARREVLALADQGQRVTVKQAKTIIQQHREPKPRVTEAQAQIRLVKPGPARVEPEPAPVEQDDDVVEQDFDEAEGPVKAAPLVVEAAPPAADVVMTIRMERTAEGQPGKIYVSIGEDGTLDRGQYPAYYVGDFAELPEVTQRACAEYFAAMGRV